jgi:hypothetical protein
LHVPHVDLLQPGKAPVPLMAAGAPMVISGFVV